MKLHKFFDQNSPENVILHAQYRASRGKCPSASFKEINNPREALKAAQAEMDQAGIPRILSLRTQALTANVIARIIEALGLRLPTIEELDRFLKKSESNLGVYAPFVEWDRECTGLIWFGELTEPFSSLPVPPILYRRLFLAIPS